ncbi:Uncharacterised protein [BD1-7 clade bacterium]|uniref:Uncharacterized protein n=1 Tax=BD1-7 clade bacterium TaxID=2029982 RepID=A0A5S9QWJ0_9GAMM|nr:Uncharacterised protein [BD1-7 clade bacterium]
MDTVKTDKKTTETQASRRTWEEPEVSEVLSVAHSTKGNPMQNQKGAETPAYRS